jgi:hypothetical protein
MQADKPRNIPKESPAGAIAAGVLVVAALAAGLWWYTQHRASPPAAAPVATTTPAAAPTPAAPVVPQHPIEQVAVDTPPEVVAPPEPLPALFDSDPALLAALADLGGAAGLAALLNPEQVIQRFVATVDSLPKRRLAPNIIPARPAPGGFITDDAGTGIGPGNAARYESYVRIAEAVDAKALVAVYVRFYPLFQQAYRELGYQNGYFNDRLVEVLDHLLVAPDVGAQLPLVRPGVFWQFADPGLEQLSAGQKILLRMGPANASRVKAKLREIRAALVGMPSEVTSPTAVPEEGAIEPSPLEEAVAPSSTPYPAPTQVP